MDKYWLWFSRTNKIGAKTQNELLKKYENPKKIWELDKDDLQQDLTKEQIQIILDKKYRQNLEQYGKYMLRNNIKMISIYDENYPEKLKNIYDPPVVLYIKGNENILNDEISIAIIGSRMCSEYGKNVARQFAYNLSKYNINVISGLAKGIDTYAHVGAIRAKGKTIAVLGNGLDIVYPQENRMLYNKIVETGGAVITEYIIGTTPEKKNFPARNRIISGLANGILVVEASNKSGTAITVDFALEQGKNIYAVPR